MTFVPVGMLGLLEVGLQVGGYGRSARFFLDGSEIERSGSLIDNREFGRWAFPRGLESAPFPVPFAVADKKPKGLFRVFVLGESAAMGFPEPSVGFPRVLEVLLRARYPDKRFEVVNAAMVAINSHIVLSITKECATHEPDLFVVHLGNNEVVGPFGASGVLGPYSASRPVVRATLAVRRTRIGQLLEALADRLRGSERRPWKGMSMFLDSQVRADDHRLARIRDQFRRNLDDICSAGTGTGVAVVVCTVPVNLKDSAPFASLHAEHLAAEQIAAWDVAFHDGVRLEGEGKHAEAIASYREAERIDDQYAELEFRQGRCLIALGKGEEAKEKFARARDLDTLRFRSDREINQAIRNVASERSGDAVYLADAERSFAEGSPGGIPGDELFLEHVHMNFSGNYLLARTALLAIAPILDAKLAVGPRPELATESECAAQLGYTDWNRLKMASELLTRVLNGPPFTAQFNHSERDSRWEAKVKELEHRLNPDELDRIASIYRTAVASAESDWMLRMNFGQLLTERDDAMGAEAQYAAALRIMHHNFAARFKLGQLYLRTGRIAEAAAHFREVVRIAPDWPDGHIGVAEALGAEGKVDEGLAIHEKWLGKAPSRKAGLLAIAAYLTRAGRMEDAKRRLLEAAEADPEDPKAYTQLGDIALKQGKRDEAIAMYEAALKRRPDWPELKAHLARVRVGGSQ